MTSRFDIIVVGGGHAGCEAAMAAASLGSSVLLVSPDLNGFAKMSLAWSRTRRRSSSGC